MKVAAFSAMTMLAGIAVGYATTDAVDVLALGFLLVSGTFFGGLAISGGLDD